MSAKLKSMFKKQISFSAGHTVIPEENEEKKENNRKEDSWRPMRRHKSNAKDVEEVALRKKAERQQHRTSLGVLEDIIKCPLCKQMLRSPRMLACQHTFCQKCLDAKVEESSKDADGLLSCPVCKATAKTSTPNHSIESILRAVDSSFVETRSDKARSLFVNFAPLTGEQRRKNCRCAKCETTCEPDDFCSHCKQVFCKVCRTLHASQLKDQLHIIIDQLQVTISKLEHRVDEFKEKTDSMKDLITKEFEAKIAALHEEKKKRLEQVDEFRIKSENSAEEIKQRILEAQIEFVEQKDSVFDAVDDDKEKIDVFMELHRKATEMISSALSWQSKVEDAVEIRNGDVARIREKENTKTSSRPRIISERKDLQRPSGLALDSRKGDIYLTCPGSAQVVVFDRQYRIVRRIQNPHMMAPQSVAFIDSLQEIFVTDKWKHAIFVFNRKGQLVRKIGEKGQGEGQLRCPEGIDILQSRNWIYIADTGNDRIQIMGVDGTYKGGIGPSEKTESSKNGSKTIARLVGSHNFNQPTDVAVSKNAIIVADCGNHKIKVFNHRGQLMFSIGGFGTIKGFLKSPEVVKLDQNKNIVVGDSDNSRVQVFSPQGTFIRSFGSPGTKVGQFGWISGLVCLSNSEVLVADSKNNTLQLF